jgi:uncharacterized membrane protein YfcA
LSPWLVALILFAAAFAAWVLSTLAGGGGGLLMLPVMTLLGQAAAVPPAIALGHFIGSPVRVWLFWKHIDWKIVRWYLPGACAGGILGAWVFSNLKADWVKVLIGLFLISTVFQFRFGEKERSFPMPLWGFLPLGFVVSLISGVVGEAGPVLNPFFLNYGADKERMIGTKAVNSLAMQLVKSGAYAAFGAMTWRYVLYGVAIGIAATLASWVGKRMLARMQSKRFRQIVVTVMVLSGLLILWQERGTVAGDSHVLENTRIFAARPGRKARPSAVFSVKWHGL